MVIAFVITFFFCVYLGYIVGRFGVLKSISQSYYKFGEKEGRLIFFLFLLSVSVPSLFIGTGWGFLSGSALIFTAVAPEYKRDLSKLVHSFGAAIGIVSALVGLAFEGLYLPLILALLFYIFAHFIGKINNRTWWVEIVCVALIIFGLIYRDVTSDEEATHVKQTVQIYSTDGNIFIGTEEQFNSRPNLKLAQWLTENQK